MMSAGADEYLPGKPDHLSGELWASEFAREQLEAFLVARHAKQPYSLLYLGKSPFVVMWDSCCTLPGLIREDRAQKVLQDHAGSVVKWDKFAKPIVIGGVSASASAYIIGEITIQLEFVGRVLPFKFGVLRGGDTGSTHAMVGNMCMVKQAWHGSVDVGNESMLFRQPPDGKGELRIPITFNRRSLPEEAFDAKAGHQRVHSAAVAAALTGHGSALIGAPRQTPLF